VRTSMATFILPKPLNDAQRPKSEGDLRIRSKNILMEASRIKIWSHPGGIPGKGMICFLKVRSLITPSA
jgi:hypothetical protein